MDKALLTFLGIGFVLCSCSESKDYSAYFGGEIINPKEKYVLFYQGEKLIDSIALDESNRFFVRFDSLSTGLYRFKHEYEYQYVYFDKNDSLMVRVNTNNFDETLWFCGKGDEKNNFLIEIYLKNLQNRVTLFDNFDSKEDCFILKADSFYNEMLKFYTAKKEDIKWSNDFDLFAKAGIDYPYYSKKEFYPIAYKKRVTKGQSLNLPPTFYDHRKNINFSNEKLADFEVYIQYINFVIDNIANSDNNHTENTALKKLEIVDSITQNQLLKNRIASHIAYRYLLENEKNAYDSVFLEKYTQISTDAEKKDKINHIVQSIQNLSLSDRFPSLVDDRLTKQQSK